MNGYHNNSSWPSVRFNLMKNIHDNTYIHLKSPFSLLAPGGGHKNSKIVKYKMSKWGTLGLGFVQATGTH